jgi:hypothetical protein
MHECGVGVRHLDSLEAHAQLPGAILRLGVDVPADLQMRTRSRSGRRERPTPRPWRSTRGWSRIRPSHGSPGGTHLAENHRPDAGRAATSPRRLGAAGRGRIALVTIRSGSEREDDATPCRGSDREEGDEARSSNQLSTNDARRGRQRPRRAGAVAADREAP